MGLKKWMAVVKSKHNGVTSSRKQDRKRAKQLKKLQNVAIAKHQPIEKIMVDAFSSKKKQKKKRRKIFEKNHMDEEGERMNAPESTFFSEYRNAQRSASTYDISESGSDTDLTYEQYLKEVQDKKRKTALEEDNAEHDDADIHRYSKLLGISETKKAKKLKAFANDGLDDLLIFCDSDDRKKLLASSTDQEISLKGSDLGDDENDVISMASDIVDLEENIRFIDEDEKSDQEKDNGEKSSKNENDENEDDSKGDIQEDIYGRTINKKTGQVIGADPKAALKKLDHLNAKGGDSQSKMEIDRAFMGLINRLSEGTLLRSHQQVSDYWRNHSKNDVKSCLTRILLRLVGSPCRLQDQLLSLYALFIALIHTFISDELSAYFVEVFLLDFVEQVSQPHDSDDKKLENCVVFIAYLLHFHVVKVSVAVELLQKLREHFTVDNLQLIVTFASYSYKVLRRHYWSAFSEELSSALQSLESALFASLPRAKFLGESISAILKAPPANIDMSFTEHHLKLFQGFRKKNKLMSEQELGMSLDDIQHVEERGRWYIISLLFFVVRCRAFVM